MSKLIRSIKKVIGLENKMYRKSNENHFFNFILIFYIFIVNSYKSMLHYTSIIAFYKKNTLYYCIDVNY